jgi:hypothetical protein
MNGVLCDMRPLMKWTSRLSRSSLATMIAWAVPSCRAGQPYAPSINVLVHVADMPAAEFKLGSKERSR